MLQPNQLVKLNQQGLEYLCSRKNTDWASRVGRILKITKPRYAKGVNALIVWNGNKRPSDAIPVKFLEIFDGTGI